MLYALKIATRYLTASKAQTALLVLGVSMKRKQIPNEMMKIL